MRKIEKLAGILVAGVTCMSNLPLPVYGYATGGDNVSNKNIDSLYFRGEYDKTPAKEDDILMDANYSPEMTKYAGLETVLSVEATFDIGYGTDNSIILTKKKGVSDYCITVYVDKRFNYVTENGDCFSGELFAPGSQTMGYKIHINPQINLNPNCAILVSRGSLVHGASVIRFGDLLAKIKGTTFSGLRDKVVVGDKITQERCDVSRYLKTDLTKTMTNNPYLMFDPAFVASCKPVVTIGKDFKQSPGEDGRLELPEPVAQEGKVPFIVEWSSNGVGYIDESKSYLIDTKSPSVKLDSQLGKDALGITFFPKNKEVTISASDYSGISKIEVCPIVWGVIRRPIETVTNSNTCTFELRGTERKSDGKTLFKPEQHLIRVWDNNGNLTEMHLSEIMNEVGKEFPVDDNSVDMKARSNLKDRRIVNLPANADISLFVTCENTRLTGMPVITVDGEKIKYQPQTKGDGDIKFVLGSLEKYLVGDKRSLEIELKAEKDAGERSINIRQVVEYDREPPKFASISMTNLDDDAITPRNEESIYARKDLKLSVMAEDEGSGVKEISLYRINKSKGRDFVSKVLSDNGVFELKGNDGDTYSYEFVLVDNCDNKQTIPLDKASNSGELAKLKTIIFDKSGPKIAVTPSKTVQATLSDDKRIFLPKKTEVFVTAMDLDEEVAHMRVYLNDECVADQTTGTYTLKLGDSPINKIRIEAEDFAGNKTEDTKEYYIDTIAPQAPTGEFINDSPEYMVKDVKVFDSVMSFRLYATDNEDGSGIDTITVMADNFQVKPNKGIYTFKSMPNKITIAVKDKAGNVGTYTLKDIQGLVPESNILIDKEKPKIFIVEPAGKVNGDWYSSDKVYQIQVEDATALKSLSVYVYGKLYREVMNGGKITKKLETTFDTRAQDFEDEDGYNIQIRTEDIRGNEAVQATTAKIDRINPEITKFIFEGTGKIEGAEIDGTERYGFFLNGDGRVSIVAQDEGMSSGLKRVYYKLIDKDGNVFDDGKGTANFKDGIAVVELPKDFKGFIEAHPEDNVGHIGDTQKPDGFVNSNATINENTIDINLPESKHKDKKGLTLYPKDVKGEIIIHPNEYGWETVSWGTRINDEVKEHGRVNVDKNGKLSGATAKVTERDRNLVLDMASILNVTDNANGITVWVSVIDKRGQKSEKEARFSIDKDAPVIKVEYSEDKESGYYTQKRTANVTIYERNFDAKDVKIGGNNTGVSTWENLDENTHQCTVDFSKDDDYQLTVDYKDLAGNLAQSYTSEKFMVDTTIPTMQVTFDNNNPLNGNFYKETRTATIRVTEHNFDPKKINVVGDGMMGEWHSDGDTHVMTMLFGRDGTYSFEVTGEDMAGNPLQPYQSETFIVDMTNPTIAIEGVEDGVSHKEDVKIRVSLSDNYIDADNTSISLESRKNGQMEMQGSLGDTTGVFTLENIPKEQTWDDAYLLSVVITDKAGNRVARDLTFTVNRFGSQYEVQQSDIMGKSTAVLPAEFVFKETSIDRIDMTKTTVDIARSGEEYKYDETLLQKEEQKTNDGYEYTYTLKTTAFAEDGKYNVGVVSVAEDGTKNASAKNNFSFIYDTTAPKIGVSGIQSGGKYMEETKPVTVDFDDLSGVDSSSIEVNGKTVELEETTDLYQKFELPKSSDTYTVVVKARDLAGNESRTEIQGVMVSKDIFDIIKGYLDSGTMILLPISVIFIGVVIFFYYALKRRKRDDSVWLENQDD